MESKISSCLSSSPTVPMEIILRVLLRLLFGSDSSDPNYCTIGWTRWQQELFTSLTLVNKSIKEFIFKHFMPLKIALNHHPRLCLCCIYNDDSKLEISPDTLKPHYNIPLKIAMDLNELTIFSHGLSDDQFQIIFKEMDRLKHLTLFDVQTTQLASCFFLLLFLSCSCS